METKLGSKSSTKEQTNPQEVIEMTHLPRTRKSDSTAGSTSDTQPLLVPQPQPTTPSQSQHESDSSAGNTSEAQPLLGSQTEATTHSQSQQLNEGEFIRKHFYRTLCTVYSKENSKTLKCKCGRSEKWHTNRRLSQCTENGPTTAFGSIRMKGFSNLHQLKERKFIRLNDKADKKTLWRLMTSHWKMSSPDLILSINGGTKGMQELPENMNIAICECLFTLSSNSKTWITTRGINVGVAKLIGNLVDDLPLYGFIPKEDLTLLGFAAWGTVYNRRMLRQEIGKCETRTYVNSRDNPAKDQFLLLPSHTHFILFDNGCARRHAFNSELDFRFEMEYFMGQPKTEKTKTAGQTGENSEKKDGFVPIVQLLIGGGYVALKYAYKAVERKIPVVVVKGSGRCAKLICWCISETKGKREFNESNINTYILEQEIMKISDDLKITEEEMKDGVQWLKNICGKYRKYICIFDVSSEKKLSECILSCILEGMDSIEEKLGRKNDSIEKIKGRKKDSIEKKKLEIKKKLDFSLKMNCWHLAEHILKTEKYESINLEHLNEIMMGALMDNKHEFVQMLLDRFMHVQSFLSDVILEKLYEKLFKDSGFHFSKRVHPTTEGGSNAAARNIVISKLTDRLVAKIYEDATKESPISGETPPAVQYSDDEEPNDSEDDPNDPENDPKQTSSVEKVNTTIDEKLEQQSEPGEGTFVPSEKELPDPKLIPDTVQLSTILEEPQETPEQSQSVTESEAHTAQTLVKQEQLPKTSGQTLVTQEQLQETSGQTLVTQGQLQETSGQTLVTQGQLQETSGQTLVPIKNKEQDLFIWAILYNRIELVRIFWILGKDHISSALIAFRMFTRMATLAAKHGQPGSVEGLQKHASEFENAAIELLSEAFEKKKMKMKVLLLRELPSWGENTCLKLAWKFKVYKFLHHPACQTLLDEIWISGCKCEQEKLKSATSQSDDVESSNRVISDQTTSSCCPAPRTKSSLYVSNIVESFTRYHAPKRIFYSYVIVNILFLVLLTLTNLFQLIKPIRGSNLGMEVISLAFIWIRFVIFIVSEVCQVCGEDEDHWKQKLTQWGRSHWNKFDLVICVIFIICFTLHLSLSVEDFEACRIFYALLCTLNYIRCLQFFYACPMLGPKVLMVWKMLKDVLFFIGIYAIFIMAYGTLKQTLIPSSDTLGWKLFVDIVQQPYWQTYGELKLEWFDVNNTCQYNGTLTNCSQASKIITLSAFVIFMLFTHILLINLLIALFAKTVENIQGSSSELWSYYRYELVKEFEKIQIFQCFRKKSSCTSSSFKIYLDPEESNKVSQFEYYCMKRWVSKKKAKEKVE